MQISSFSEEQQMALWLANEASKLTAEFEAACTMEATVSEDEAEDFWTIRAYPTGAGLCRFGSRAGASQAGAGAGAALKCRRGCFF